LVEAGWGSFIKNLFRKTLKPQEIESLFRSRSTFPAGMSAEQQEYMQAIGNYIRNLAKTNPSGPSMWNKGVPTKFVRTEMTPNLQKIQNILDNNQNLSQAHVDEILTLMGGAAKHATDSITSPMSWWGKIRNLIPGGDQVLKQSLPGIQEMTTQGHRMDVSLEKFLLHGADIGQPNSGMIITNPAALHNALENIAQDLGVKSGNRQMIEGFKMTTQALLAGLVINMGGKAFNAVKPNNGNFDNMGGTGGNIVGPGGMNIEPLNSNPLNNNPLDPYQKTKEEQGQNNPLGGTTNGNNFGNFGGQFNQSWTPPKPNLPHNPNDWLPTNTTDYYSAVKKSDISDNNIRLASGAKEMLMDFPDAEDVAKNFVTILEQGEPGEATLKFALDYLQEVSKGGEPILQAYQSNPNMFFDAPNQVKETAPEK